VVHRRDPGGIHADRNRASITNRSARERTDLVGVPDVATGEVDPRRSIRRQRSGKADNRVPVVSERLGERETQPAACPRHDGEGSLGCVSRG